MTGEGFITGVFLGDKVGDNDCIMQIIPKCNNLHSLLLHYTRFHCALPRRIPAAQQLHDAPCAACLRMKAMCGWGHVRGMVLKMKHLFGLYSVHL